MKERWYQVLVKTPRGRYLIAIEAASKREARGLIAVDFGDESILRVQRL
jgi:hypothetical protein